MNEITPYLSGLMLAYAAFLLAMASPGPNVLTILGTSMGVGRRSGLILALGMVVGTFCWAMLTVIGLSAVLAAYADALIAIKIAGGFYLLWLAYKAFRSAATASDEIRTEALREGGAFGYLLRGLTVQMTNPKTALAWVAITSVTLHDDTPFWVSLALIVGVTTLSFVVHSAYALLFSASAMARIYGRMRRIIQGTLGAAFTLLGVRLLTTRL